MDHVAGKKLVRWVCRFTASGGSNPTGGETRTGRRFARWSHPPGRVRALFENCCSRDCHSVDLPPRAATGVRLLGSPPCRTTDLRSINCTAHVSSKPARRTGTPAEFPGQKRSRAQSLLMLENRIRQTVAPLLPLSRRSERRGPRYEQQAGSIHAPPVFKCIGCRIERALIVDVEVAVDPDLDRVRITSTPACTGAPAALKSRNDCAASPVSFNTRMSPSAAQWESLQSHPPRMRRGPYRERYE